MNDISSILKTFDDKKKIIITAHVNPDGDAIGSELALARYLKGIGKNVRIINLSPTPHFLQFLLSDSSEIELYDAAQHQQVIVEAELIIMLDLNQLSRTGLMEDQIRLSSAKKICIDHHEYPENFADIELIDTTKSSTGELIYELLNEANYKLDYNIALPLYVAILTDTGSFKYDRTTPKVHRIVANLLETGIETKNIFREIYDQGTSNRIKLLGRALSSLTLCCDDKVSYMIVRKSDLFETATSEEDVEGFVNYNLSIKGVEVGLLFFETNEGIKVSFRSVDTVPVNQLANKFNGGGHFHAAGARINGNNFEQSIKNVLNETEKYFV